MEKGQVFLIVLLGVGLLCLGFAGGRYYTTKELAEAIPTECPPCPLPSARAGFFSASSGILSGLSQDIGLPQEEFLVKGSISLRFGGKVKEIGVEKITLEKDGVVQILNKPVGGNPYIDYLITYFPSKEERKVTVEEIHPGDNVAVIIDYNLVTRELYKWVVHAFRQGAPPPVATPPP